MGVMLTSLRSELDHGLGLAGGPSLAGLYIKEEKGADMSDNRTIQGTVTTKSEDSSYRVAFDLAIRISNVESSKQDRAYWLKLYADCWHVVTYGTPRSP